MPRPSDAATDELRAIRFFVGGLFLLALFSALYFARALLFPLVLALVMTLTLRPVSRGLQRVGVPAGVSAVLLVGLFGGLVGGLIYWASGPVTGLLDRAPEIGQDLRWKLRDLLRSVDEMQDATEQVQDMASGGDAQATEVVLEQSGLLTDVVGSLASAGTSVLVAAVLTIFLLASGEFFPRRIVETSRRAEDKARAMTVVQGVERQISRYLAAITVINAGLGLAIGGALWLVGLPNAHVWGLAAFLLNYLPFLGAIAGTVAVGIVGLVTFDTVAQGLLCSAVYLSLTSLEGNVVTPMFVGRQLSINTVSVFVTVILWVWLWGIAGAFLAVPLLVIIKTVADNVPPLQSFARFLEPA